MTGKCYGLLDVSDAVDIGSFIMKHCRTAYNQVIGAN